MTRPVCIQIMPFNNVATSQQNKVTCWSPFLHNLVQGHLRRMAPPPTITMHSQEPGEQSKNDRLENFRIFVSAL